MGILDEQRPPGPHGWIQFKGTELCMDLNCECGELSHIDGEFVYTVSCPTCGREWALSGFMKLVPPDDEWRRWHEPVRATLH